jgi:hypothetical protein
MLTAVTLSGIFPQFPPDFVPPLPLACSGDPVDPASDVKPGRARSFWDCHVAASPTSVGAAIWLRFDSPGKSQLAPIATLRRV